MWLGTKQMEKLTKARLSPVSKPRHINSIFTVNTPILYIYATAYSHTSSKQTDGKQAICITAKSCTISEQRAYICNSI
jgi:hypothetical protein